MPKFFVFTNDDPYDRNYYETDSESEAVNKYLENHDSSKSFSVREISIGQKFYDFFCTLLGVHPKND